MLGITAVYLGLLGLFVYTISPINWVGFVSAATSQDNSNQRPIVNIKPNHLPFSSPENVEVEQLVLENVAVPTESSTSIVSLVPIVTEDIDSGIASEVANEQTDFVETAVISNESTSNLLADKSASSTFEFGDPSSRPISSLAENLTTGLLSEQNSASYGQLIIPAIGVNHLITNIPVVNGTWDISQLDDQIGHLQTTGEHPGDRLAMTFIGHVTLPWPGTGPFADLILLKHGEQIIYRWNGFDYTYEVSRIFRVKPEDVHVLYHDDPNGLQLATCSGWNLLNREYGERLITRATLITIEPTAHQ